MSDVAAPRQRTRPEMSGPVLGMVLFVASEAMFFAAFFGGYFTIKANAPEWPPAGTPHLKFDIATVLSVFLIISGITELYHELGTFRTHIDSHSSRCHRRWESGFICETHTMARRCHQHGESIWVHVAVQKCRTAGGACPIRSRIVCHG